MNIEVKNGIYTFKGTDIGFSFYTDLSAVNKVRFVNTVTSYIVDENYNSIIRDLMFDFEIIDIFTDIDLTEISESVDSLSKIEEFLSETNIVDIVKKNMADGLLQSLNNAADDNIAFHTGVQRNSLPDSLSGLMETVNKKIKEVDTESLMDMAQKLNNMTDDLSAESILKAYVNSDLYKKEVEKTQKQKSIQKRIEKFRKNCL